MGKLKYPEYSKQAQTADTNMQHEYTDKMVTPWGGMKEVKMLIGKTGISK